MNSLTGQPGELRMTIQIKRAATGETETHELIGKELRNKRKMLLLMAA